jgi:1,2-phenylacetyl-CoA epoxidase catalytic subunit
MIGPIPVTAELGRHLTDLNPGLFRSAFEGQANAILVRRTILARHVLTLNPLGFRLRTARRLGLPLLRQLDWAHTIARHWLYETADAIRLDALKSSDDNELAGLAAKMDREEVYHRMHAEMWAQRLRDEDRFRGALEAQWPSALGVLHGDLRPRLVERVRDLGFELDAAEPIEREVSDEFEPLWGEMTSVRRSAPAGAQW